MPEDRNPDERGLTFQGKPRTWGLRFSLLDGIVLAVAVVATAATYDFTAGLSLLGLFVVAHFFLFCNVFRIRRKPELIWAGVFVANCLAWSIFHRLHIAGICLPQCLLTAILVIYEIRQPTYHGVFARSWNARLDEYLAGKV